VLSRLSPNTGVSLDSTVFNPAWISDQIEFDTATINHQPSTIHAPHAIASSHASDPRATVGVEIRSTMVASNDDARLPATLIPTHYDLTYDRIDLVNHTFEGRVSIEGSAATSVSSITLHALDVVVFNATLKSQGDDKMFKAEEFKYHKRKQTLEMIWSEKEVLKEGSSFVLILDFKGILNDQMRGLYRSTFVGMDGKQHTMATTQFEPTDARRAFPCFDEPALKASFCLTVTIPAELSCISNTPISSMHTNFEGVTFPTKTITFQKTPKMSSYLLAMVMGPQMDGISSTSRQIVTTIYTVPGKARQGEFCLDVASRCLDLYQDIFKIPYPLVKSDLLAIPDFAAGAMEKYVLCAFNFGYC
jgi:aminopeptidase N